MVSSYTCYNGMTIWTCLSTDETPVGKNGDILQIMDTEKQYRFDGENNEWIGLQKGESGIMFVSITTDTTTGSLVSNKTAAEIIEAVKNNEQVVAVDISGEKAWYYNLMSINDSVIKAAEFNTLMLTYDGHDNISAAYASYIAVVDTVGVVKATRGLAFVME